MAGSSSASSRSHKAPSLIPLGHHTGKPAIPLHRPVTLIGSRSNARIHLTSSSVSKAHALIVKDGPITYIRDLASRSHLFVGGEQVRDQDLEDGQLIKIGSFTFKFTAGSERPAQVTATQLPPAKLQVSGADYPVPIDQRVLLIGRRSTCDVHLLEESVSTAHAVLFEMNGHRHIRDLGSRTGTFVNGVQVHQHQLNEGDKIRIGDTTLTYTPGEAFEPAEEELSLSGTGAALTGLAAGGSAAGGSAGGSKIPVGDDEFDIDAIAAAADEAEAKGAAAHGAADGEAAEIEGADEALEAEPAAEAGEQDQIDLSPHRARHVSARPEPDAIPLDETDDAAEGSRAPLGAPPARRRGWRGVQPDADLVTPPTPPDALPTDQPSSAQPPTAEPPIAEPAVAESSVIDDVLDLAADTGKPDAPAIDELLDLSDAAIDAPRVESPKAESPAKLDLAALDEAGKADESAADLELAAPEASDEPPRESQPPITAGEFAAPPASAELPPLPIDVAEPIAVERADEPETPLIAPDAIDAPPADVKQEEPPKARRARKSRRKKPADEPTETPVAPETPALEPTGGALGSAEVLESTEPTPASALDLDAATAAAPLDDDAIADALAGDGPASSESLSDTALGREVADFTGDAGQIVEPSAQPPRADALPLEASPADESPAAPPSDESARPVAREAAPDAPDAPDARRRDYRFGANQDNFLGGVPVSLPPLKSPFADRGIVPAAETPDSAASSDSIEEPILDLAAEPAECGADDPVADAPADAAEQIEEVNALIDEILSPAGSEQTRENKTPEKKTASPPSAPARAASAGSADTSPAHTPRADAPPEAAAPADAAPVGDAPSTDAPSTDASGTDATDTDAPVAPIPLTPPLAVPSPALAPPPAQSRPVIPIPPPPGLRGRRKRRGDRAGEQTGERAGERAREGAETSAIAGAAPATGRQALRDDERIPPYKGSEPATAGRITRRFDGFTMPPVRETDVFSQMSPPAAGGDDAGANASGGDAFALDAAPSPSALTPMDLIQAEEPSPRGGGRGRRPPAVPRHPENRGAGPSPHAPSAFGSPPHAAPPHVAPPPVPPRDGRFGAGPASPSATAATTPAGTSATLASAGVGLDADVASAQGGVALAEPPASPSVAAPPLDVPSSDTLSALSPAALSPVSFSPTALSPSDSSVTGAVADPASAPLGDAAQPAARVRPAVPIAPPRPVPPPIAIDDEHHDRAARDPAHVQVRELGLEDFQAAIELDQSQNRRPPIVFDREHAADPDLLAHDQRKRRLRRVPMLLAAMIGLMGAAWAACWFAVPVKSRIEASIRFENYNRLKEGERRSLRTAQQALLISDRTRMSAKRLLSLRDAAISPGFLEESEKYVSVASLADWPAEQGGVMMLRFDGTDIERDKARLRAMAEALLEANADGLLRDAKDARGKYENLLARIQSNVQRQRELSAEIEKLQTLGNAAPNSDQIQAMKEQVARLERAWGDALAAQKVAQSELDQLRHATNEPAQPADSKDGAGNSAADSDEQVKQLQSQLAEASEKLNAATAARAQQAAAARKALDDSLREFQKQIADARELMKDSPELAAYISSAQKLQETTRTLIDDLIRRQENYYARLNDLKQQLTEKMERRRAEQMQSDPELRDWNERLQTARRQYNAARASGLKKESEDAGQQVTLLENMIRGKQELLPGDSFYADAINQLQKIIDATQQNVEDDRKRTDQVLTELQKGFTDSAAVGRLPEAQKAVAGELEKRLADINAARQQYSAAISSAGASDDDETTKALRTQVASILANIDARRKQIADQTARSSAQHNPQDRAATLAAKEKDVLDKTQAEMTARQMFTNKERELREAQAMSETARSNTDRLMQLQTDKASVDREIADARNNERQYKEAAEQAVRPGAIEVNSVPGADHRLTYAMGSCAAIFLAFAVMIVLTLHGAAQEMSLASLPRAIPPDAGSTPPLDSMGVQAEELAGDPELAEAVERPVRPAVPHLSSQPSNGHANGQSNGAAAAPNAASSAAGGPVIAPTNGQPHDDEPDEQEPATI